MKTQAPCGSWPSPITAEIVAGKSPRFAEPLIQNHNNEERIFWLASQPEEKGRLAVMMQRKGEQRCILPYPLNCRSKVHEYGGGAYCVEGDVLYFVLADDQRIYRGNFSAGTFIPEPLTAPGNFRFADLTYDKHRERLIAVCEHHREEGEPENSIVAISLDGSMNLQVLVSGDNFYAYPRPSPNGEQLCWISWNHPNMPWDSTALWLAHIEADGTLAEKKNIITEGEESIFQPSWRPNGELFFVSDRDNWWNLYCVKNLQAKDYALQAITELPVEFATPLWTLGMSCYGFLNNDSLLTTYTQDGKWRLARIHLQDNNRLEHIESPLDSISIISCANNTAVFFGANATISPQLFKFNNETTPAFTNTTQFPLLFAKDNISHPLSVEFNTANNEACYGFYYAPTHTNLTPADKPPMIFICHGGPTGATDTALNLKIQYWTNRGFAVMDVNYRGSTGYGRRYRQRLHNHWGIADVEDMCAAADYAVAQGWAAPDKLIIKGSSAGGYTVLASLCFSQRFNAGVSLYGIGDLEALVRDTHKFEARYLDSLVGDWKTEREIYSQRSPINAVNNIQCPILVFQGLEDKVVPPNQAQKMVDAVAAKGLPVGYITFANEGHGFRDPENIKTMLNAEHSFYCQVFNLPHPNDIPTLPIQNLN